MIAASQAYETYEIPSFSIKLTYKVGIDWLVDDPVAVSVVGTRKNGVSFADLHSETGDIFHACGCVTTVEVGREGLITEESGNDGDSRMGGCSISEEVHDETSLGICRSDTRDGELHLNTISKSIDTISNTRKSECYIHPDQFAESC